MEKKSLVNHVKGQKHPGKTKWSKVLRNESKPVVDGDNPELAFKAGKNFYKAGKKCVVA